MPKLAFDRAAARDFMESFSYAVPYEDDFDPKERAREERARMRAAQQRTARDQLRTAIEPALAAIKEAIPGIRSATIARALREATNDVIRDQPDDDEAGGFMVNNEHEDDQLALHGFGHHIEIWREDGNVHIAVNDEDEGNTTHFTLGTPDETQKC
jgi:hypothetical protein